jgi:hypothetical protein
MSSNQKNIATKIDAILKEESQTKDFLLRSEPKTDSVTLSQVFDLKASKRSLHKGDYIYSKALRIGSYNQEDEFKLSDLENACAKQEQQKKDNIFVIVGLIILTAYLSLASAFYVKKVVPAKHMHKMEMTSGNMNNNII